MAITWFFSCMSRYRCVRVLNPAPGETSAPAAASPPCDAQHRHEVAAGRRRAVHESVARPPAPVRPLVSRRPTRCLARRVCPLGRASPPWSVDDERCPPAPRERTAPRARRAPRGGRVDAPTRRSAPPLRAHLSVACAPGDACAPRGACAPGGARDPGTRHAPRGRRRPRLMCRPQRTREYGEDPAPVTSSAVGDAGRPRIRDAGPSWDASERGERRRLSGRAGLGRTRGPRAGRRSRRRGCRRRRSTSRRPRRGSTAHLRWRPTGEPSCRG